MNEYDRINVQAKVINVSPLQIVGSGKRKQEVIIGDPTSTATLTLWENDIDSLSPAKSYSMKRLLVRVFNDTYSLSMPATGATVEEIDDITATTDTMSASLESTLYNAEVCGVKDIEHFKVCIACNGKVSPLPLNISLGCCNKCNMEQKLSACSEEKLVAKIVINAKNNKSTGPNGFTSLVGYGDLLKAITETELVNTETLLSANPFHVTYNSYFVITGISRD